MFKIIRDDEVVDQMYTIRGFVGNHKERNDRYIQLSMWTGEPIINTRCAYMAGRVVVFPSMESAYKFLHRFIYSGKRNNKYFIDWEVIPYRPYGEKTREYTFREVESEDYGSYCVIDRIRCM